MHAQVVSQFWVILSFVADSLAVAAQGLIADRMGGGSLPAAREVASRVRICLLSDSSNVKRRIVLSRQLWGSCLYMGHLSSTVSLWMMTCDQVVLIVCVGSF